MSDTRKSFSCGEEMNSETPYDVLRAFFRGMHGNSVGEVLFKSEKIKSAEYLDEVCQHPSLHRFQEVLPETGIVENVRSYCSKDKKVIELEQELIRNELTLNNLQNDAQARLSENIGAPIESPKVKSYSLGGIVLLGLSLAIVVTVLVPYGFIFGAAIALSLAILAFYRYLKDDADARKQKEDRIIGDDLLKSISDQKEKIDSIRHQIYEINSEKAQILQSINKEEQQLKKQYWKRKESHEQNDH